MSDNNNLVPGQANRTGALVTPESTPAPEESGTKSDTRTSNEEQKTESEGAVQVYKPIEDTDKIIEEVLSCKEDEYHEILSIEKLYATGNEESKAIETAAYNRGLAVFPKPSEGDASKIEKAEKAWKSKLMSSLSF
jgi:hypothetical protein